MLDRSHLLLFRILNKPLRRTTHQSQSQTVDSAKACLLAACDAVIVERLELLWFSAPDRATKEVARQASAAYLEEVAPYAPATVALAHLKIENVI